MPYLGRAADYWAWLEGLWFWPCSEWKYVLYDQDAFTVKIWISFTGVAVLYVPALFFYEQYSGLLLSVRGRGCLCSRSQNQGGVPFPPCVSKLPPSLHNSCTFALCSSFCTLYSHSQTQSVTHSCSANTQQTSSHYSWNNDILEFSLYLRRIIFSGSTVLLNVIIELDVLYFFCLFCVSGLKHFIIAGKCTSLLRIRSIIVLMPAAWAESCAIVISAVLWSVQAWQRQLLSCFTGFSWATVSGLVWQSSLLLCENLSSGSQGSCLKQCLIWMLWQLVWILRFLPRQDKLDFHGADMSLEPEPFLL